MMQCWKEVWRCGVGIAEEVLILTTQLTSALISTSADQPTDMTAIGLTCAVVEGFRKV